MSIEEERSNQLREMANQAIQNIETARDWLLSIDKEHTNNIHSWHSLAEGCDSLVKDIVFQLKLKEQGRQGEVVKNSMEKREKAFTEWR